MVILDDSFAAEVFVQSILLSVLINGPEQQRDRSRLVQSVLSNSPYDNKALRECQEYVNKGTNYWWLQPVAQGLSQRNNFDNQGITKALEMSRQINFRDCLESLRATVRQIIDKLVGTCSFNDVEELRKQANIAAEAAAEQWVRDISMLVYVSGSLWEMWTNQLKLFRALCDVEKATKISNWPHVDCTELLKLDYVEDRAFRYQFLDIIDQECEEGGKTAETRTLRLVLRILMRCWLGFGCNDIDLSISLTELEGVLMIEGTGKLKNDLLREVGYPSVWFTILSNLYYRRPSGIGLVPAFVDGGKLKFTPDDFEVHIVTTSIQSKSWMQPF